MNARMLPIGAVLLLAPPFALGASAQGLDGLPLLKRGSPPGFANAGWKYDRYQELPSLDAHTSMVVADLSGPGIIRHFHTTRHQPAELFARGIVLEIWYDDATEPAVMCPLADFFGDGCNGSSMYFSTPLIECAPWAYNTYIPMPFRERARVILRNDTDRDAMNYSYVEWEQLPAWDEALSYFHATYARSRFALTPETSHTFFEVEGAGHILGRQFSVQTEEPIFRDFGVVMEGNNEIDIDGAERAIDYLGTEDSFTFSWGFQSTFAGLHAGMPYILHGDRNALSIYRFHDHMPIRFDRGLTWRINWAEEKGFTSWAPWREAVDKGGCMVDYATVFYWYQDSPAGYAHQPLPEVRMRGNKPPASDAELAAMLQALPTPERSSLSFDTAADLDLARVLGSYPETHPFWLDEPQPRGGHPGNPNPGRRGIVGMHAASQVVPTQMLLRLRSPEGGPARLRIVVSGDPYEAPGRSEFALRAGVRLEGGMAWLGSEIVDAGDPPSEANWRTLEYALPEGIGEDVGVVVEVGYGGPNAAMNEEAFLDEVSLVR